MDPFPPPPLPCPLPFLFEHLFLKATAGSPFRLHTGACKCASVHAQAWVRVQGGAPHLARGSGLGLGLLPPAPPPAPPRVRPAGAPQRSRRRLHRSARPDRPDPTRPDPLPQRRSAGRRRCHGNHKRALIGRARGRSPHVSRSLIGAPGKKKIKKK